VKLGGSVLIECVIVIASLDDTLRVRNGIDVWRRSISI